MKHLLLGMAVGTVIGAAMTCKKGQKLMSELRDKVKDEVERRYKTVEKSVKDIDLSPVEPEEVMPEPAKTTVKKQTRKSTKRTTTTA